MIKKTAGRAIGGIITVLIYSLNASANPAQDAFLDNLRALCGKAYEGKVTIDNATGGSSFADKYLVMHVRHCGEKELHIPFHVGEDRSRTWVLAKSETGLSLKHDHRHEDGTPDAMTLYGGHTDGSGWATAQSFPVDTYSQELFVENAIPQSAGNTWHMYIYPGKFFSYRLTREGREFRVDFDLTKTVPLPPAPWGSE